MMVKQAARHEKLDAARGGFRVSLAYAEDSPPSGPKNTWLEMAYHEGYLSRKKFRELKRRYAKVHALISQGRGGHPV